MPGMRMSMTTTSAPVSLASRTASAPVPASPATSISGVRSISLRNPARTSGWSSARMTCVPHDHSIDADLRSQMGDAAYEQAAAHGRSLTSTRAIQYGLEDPHQDPQQHEAARKQEVQPEQRRGA